MYADVIKRITDAEEAARKQKQDTLVRAKNMVSDAEKEGRTTLAGATERAEGENKKLMQAADKKAADYAVKLEAETSELQERIRAAAGERMEQAASLIVERILKS